MTDDELIQRHNELTDYHDSLMRTHRRICRIASKSLCAYRRATRIGRKIIERSRWIKAEATSVYTEFRNRRNGTHG